MRILYSSVHEILEYDELCQLTELEGVTNPGFGIEVFSLGAFSNPVQSGGFMRSVIPKGRFYPDLFQLAMQSSSDFIHEELINWADVWVCMHNPRLPGQNQEQPWLHNNLHRFLSKGKKVVWRSIGQSTPSIERELVKYRQMGMKIMRYSPLEEKLPGYAGADAMIRFAKDEDEFSNWNGQNQQVITIAQSYKKRGEHLKYPLWEKVSSGFNKKVYGTENADLGKDWGGSPSYEQLKAVLRENRVFFYSGTVPAPYTLSLMEAMMTGIPVVAVGAGLRKMSPYDWENYEVPHIISNGVNGYISDNIDELRGYIQALLDDGELARRIGDAGRKTAIELFGKRQIMNQWSDFLRRL